MASALATSIIKKYKPRVASTIPLEQMDIQEVSINHKTNSYDNESNVSEMDYSTSTNYPNLEKLNHLCKSFIGEKIQLSASFKNRTIPIKNPNLIGDLLEDLFFPFYNETCPDFEEGPKQESPDFFAGNKSYQFEQKAFLHSAGFDISNFTSFLHQISKPGGLEMKLFRTKYLVYEYGMEEECFVIKNFWMLSIWQLPKYDGIHPISMQVKKDMWYNIRPGAKSSWNDPTKTPQKFIEKILECLEKCPQIKDKDTLKDSILVQMEQAKIQGWL